MLYREIIAVCSQIHTKYINTLCGQNVEFLSVKLVLDIVTTGTNVLTSCKQKSLKHNLPPDVTLLYHMLQCGITLGRDLRLALHSSSALTVVHQLVSWCTTVLQFYTSLVLPLRGAPQDRRR
jgi:hypothetical protein